MSYYDLSSKNQDQSKKQDGSRVTGLNKAAVVLMSLDSENVTKVLSLMDQYEIKIISQSVLSQGSLPVDSIENILREANKQLYNSVILMQNVESTKQILESMLGEGEIDNIINNLKDTNSNTWTKISQINSEILASYLKNEHPQTIALIISKLDPPTSAKVLSLFPDNLVLDVLTRIPKIDSVKRELVQSIEHTLRDEFISGSLSSVKMDYKKLVADIFNSFDRNTEVKFMKMVEDYDKSMADYIQEYMFTFDHLIKIDSAGVQKILREADKTKLALSLKGASQEIKDLFFKNMSERAGRIMKDDMEAMGPVRVREVDEAQSYIINIARNLINSGDITISEGGEDEFVN